MTMAGLNVTKVFELVFKTNVEDLKASVKLNFDSLPYYHICDLCIMERPFEEFILHKYKRVNGTYSIKRYYYCKACRSQSVKHLRNPTLIYNLIGVIVQNKDTTPKLISSSNFYNVYCETYEALSHDEQQLIKNPDQINKTHLKNEVIKCYNSIRVDISQFYPPQAALAAAEEV